MTTPSAAGQRFLGSADFYWMKDIAKILKQGLGAQGPKGPVHFHTGLFRSPVRSVRSRFAHSALRAREAPLGFLGQGEARAGLDDAPGPRNHS